MIFYSSPLFLFLKARNIRWLGGLSVVILHLFKEVNNVKIYIRSPPLSGIDLPRVSSPTTANTVFTVIFNFCDHFNKMDAYYN